ncbi:MAG: hypothetical protein JXA37_05770 [Chloroflexia bacterium]|nr:hypothetical protein [Chloroflexia bacterium]
MSERRRWPTMLGLLLTTALGAVLSYLLSRRARWRRERSPDQASLGELAARLRQKARERLRTHADRPAQENREGEIENV